MRVGTDSLCTFYYLRRVEGRGGEEDQGWGTEGGCDWMAKETRASHTALILRTTDIHSGMDICYKAKSNSWKS